eukprot:CAMPEP_0177296050 /NCGR_PEP_ID=MMETSP0368-20130122/2211_1 /TAXON_ID=447022 ORGANISM="Scrippsiella hangoei-like, Strain SHHI-4" /NCGR_SAMPLE_ID=MMETSP0368 /ASSEMBLY_ACC=CAM_ASM_000363 /LENGTH=1009 /DNA_ID=CAMNT_0018754141 /DNA_START=41 /DNA_END=3067 /DNA_ORIENTATION=+
MVLVAGAAVAAVTGMKVFDYNRDNFMEDREQRLKMEFAQRKFRITQGKLWREDVRGIVSLTEKKLSILLLVDVLLLSFSVNLWTEGRLAETTPAWLTMGMQIAIVIAFFFLVLAVWLGMHAAVAAQSYQTRLLTQLVRLPIPSWEELEACRTYASEFERVEPRQMFRIPFLFGKTQEDVAKDSATATSSGDGRALGGSEEASTQPLTIAAAVAADPWGLERRGEDVYELGCSYGKDCANLRHIKLIRQAAVYWQTYEAFARVSMSVGVVQLLIGLSYYMIGYTITQLHDPVAAFASVTILVGASYLVSAIDLTLSSMERHLFQLSLAFGPAMSGIAAYRSSRDMSLEIAECFAPLAFFSHALVVGLMTILVKVRTQENGAMLPLAFQGVLFLDVFGWVRHKHANDDTAGPTVAPGSGAGSTGASPGRRSSLAEPRQDAPGGSGREEDQMSYYAADYLEPARLPPDRFGERDEHLEPDVAVQSQVVRPALSCIAYDADGRPLPFRPDDSKPVNSAQDLRKVPGAPRMWETVNALEPAGKEFWDPVTFMPSEGRGRRMMDEWVAEGLEGQADVDLVSNVRVQNSLEEEGYAIETGHDNEIPGLVPFMIFRNSAWMTTLVWLLAGIYYMLQAADLVEFAPKWFREDGDKHNLFSVDWMAHRGLPRPTGIGMLEVQDSHLERVHAAWPYESMVPRGLACDEDGVHFLVTDGLSMYQAELGEAFGDIGGSGGGSGSGHGGSGHGSRGRRVARFRFRRKSAASGSAFLAQEEEDAPVFRASFSSAQRCAALQGEALEDVAILCSPAAGGSASRCEALALHDHGRRLSGCPLSPPPAAAAAPSAEGSGFSAPLAQSWLQHATSDVDSAEKPGWIVLDANCARGSGSGAEALRRGCVSVGTTSGRIAQLQHSSASDKILPVDAFTAVGRQEGSPATASVLEAMRSANGQRVGYLHSQREAVHIFHTTKAMGGDVVAESVALSSGGKIGAFCVGGGYLYVLGEGPSPSMWRLPLAAAA